MDCPLKMVAYTIADLGDYSKVKGLCGCTGKDCAWWVDYDEPDATIKGRCAVTHRAIKARG